MILGFCCSSRLIIKGTSISQLSTKVSEQNILQATRSFHDKRHHETSNSKPSTHRLNKNVKPSTLDIPKKKAIPPEKFPKDPGDNEVGDGLP